MDPSWNSFDDELLCLNIASDRQFEFHFPQNDLKNVTNIRVTFARTLTKKGLQGRINLSAEFFSHTYKYFLACSLRLVNQWSRYFLQAYEPWPAVCLEPYLWITAKWSYSTPS